MSKVVEFVTFNIKEDVSVSDFLLSSDAMNDGFLAKQKGYISRKLIVSGTLWADMVLRETMDDAINAANTSGEDYPLSAGEYFTFIENADMRHFTVEKNYGKDNNQH